MSVGPLCILFQSWSTYRKEKLISAGNLGLCSLQPFLFQQDNAYRTVLLLDCPFVAHLALTTYPDDCL